MRQGYEKQLWNHTALIAYIIARAHSDPKRKIHYADFHPFESRAKRKATITRDTIGQLKMFLSPEKRAALDGK